MHKDHVAFIPFMAEGTQRIKRPNAIPYWNVNIPEDQWTDECPEYLTEVDDADRAQLAVRDRDYVPMTWKRVQHIVDTNDLAAFTRVPSELRRYRKYMGQLKREYGSVMNFILQQRLQWSNLTPEGAPFEHPDDIKILYNDWPYGMDADIVHLVVWVKFRFDEDPVTGDLTSMSRKQIDEYVTKTFKTGASSTEVTWFKNWAALKSVHAIEHFHVMLYRPDMELIKELTDNDVSLSNKLTNGHTLPGTRSD